MTDRAASPSWLRRTLRAPAAYWGVAALLLVWQVSVSLSDVNAIVLPAPTAVIADIVASPALYAANALQTIVVACIGLVIGVALGAVLAALAWTSRILEGLLTPFGLIFSSIPVVALIPIVARILGYNINTVVAIVVILCFFPAFVFVGAGLRDTPPGSGDLLKVFGAGRWQHFYRVVLPSAVPGLMMALRVCAPEAVLAAMLAEFLMGSSGLGYLFRFAVGDFETARALGVSVIATIASVTCFTLALAAERRVRSAWK